MKTTTGNILVSRQSGAGANDSAYQDPIDEIRAQWALELPDLDTSGIAILGRARWITLASRPRIDGIFQSHGLDSGEADVLFTLLRSGPPYRLRPTELFRSLMISSGGMSHRLSRLQTAGLVRRTSTEKDGRSLLVELTDEGKRCAEQAFRKDAAAEADMLQGLTDHERAELERLLRKLSWTLPAATDE
ncbi:MarR family transcriptional regulator [Agrobacterium tumefaciens]|uniref:MarR family winged helix-turn-helix transcriptional regulator n=1 Tax=Agrobacterium tumefaciens TaxID=358 RepID=UPI001571C33A|nr:MarR family transcriptional regulator [Agrobacterium tumefaciens]NTA83964.1 MarR family transcriptional regulator [Agrobacterium tumefaciens]